MLSTRGQQGLALAVVSLVSLGVVYVICFWCRRKRLIRQDNHLYDPQEPPVIQREGSRFAVTRSKTVTKHNQIARRLPPEPPEEEKEFPPVGTNTHEGPDCQSSYQNIDFTLGTFEPTYVDPIPTNVYGNDEDDRFSYENVFPTPSIKHQSDGSDYENAFFLGKESNEDEPDYVNQGES